MIQVVLHPAERCINELHYTKVKAWWDKVRFDVVVKWMVVYYWRVKDGHLPEPERPVDNEPAAVAANNKKGRGR